MSRVTVHSKSSALGVGPEGPPPPPPGGMKMIGGLIGLVETVMVTSTVALPPFASWASTVTAYSDLVAASKVTPAPTAIWPAPSMSKEEASAPERL